MLLHQIVQPDASVCKTLHFELEDQRTEYEYIYILPRKSDILFCTFVDAFSRPVCGHDWLGATTALAANTHFLARVEGWEALTCLQ